MTPSNDPPREPDRQPTGTNDTATRAVSDVVAFILAFSMITLMIGVVYVGGVTQIEAMQNNAAVENTARGFGTLSRNVRELRTQGVPSRMTSLELAGGSLRIGSPVTFNVTIVEENEWYVVEARPIVFSAEGGAKIRYVNGAIVRTTDGESSWMAADPPVVVGDRTVVPFIRTRADGSQSIGGASTIQIRTQLANRQVFGTYRGGGERTVRFNVTSSRAAAWKSYLEAEGGDCSLVGNTTTCTWTAESVRLSVARIDVEMM